MVKAIKELKKRLNAKANAQTLERDEEGSAILNMTVRRDEDFLSDFSFGAKPMVSGEVASFLEESAKAFSPREQVHIKIHSDCIDGEEEAIYTGALREYYVRRYNENRRELNLNALLSIVFAAVGIGVLTLAILFTVLNFSPVISETIDIFAWVFIWEAVDLFFLERMALRADRARYLRFIAAKIDFLPLNQS